MSKITASLDDLVCSALLVLFEILVIYWMWNATAPQVFGLHSITFFQAWGLSILSSVMFRTGRVRT